MLKYFKNGKLLLSLYLLFNTPFHRFIVKLNLYYNDSEQWLIN